MKKILALVLALAMALALVACGDKGGGEQQEGGTPNTTGEEKVVKIGVFEPLTGDNGAGGKQEVLGMQYANYVQPTVDINGETPARSSWRSSITAPQPRTARPRPLSWSTRA